MNAPMRITKAFIIVLSAVVLGPALVNGQTAVKPASHLPNFFAPYTPRQVPEPRVANSGRLDSLLRNGRIMLSLEDAIALALENNLDLPIARCNLAIADTDVLRANTGNSVRVLATGLLTGTPAGGLGRLG